MHRNSWLAADVTHLWFFFITLSPPPPKVISVICMQSPEQYALLITGGRKQLWIEQNNWSVNLCPTEMHLDLLHICKQKAFWSEDYLCMKGLFPYTEVVFSFPKNRFTMLGNLKPCKGCIVWILFAWPDSSSAFFVKARMDAGSRSGSASQPLDFIMTSPGLVATGHSRPVREAGLLCAELQSPEWLCFFSQPLAPSKGVNLNL